MRDATAPACACLGPEKGETLCPCELRRAAQEVTPDEAKEKRSRLEAVATELAHSLSDIDGIECYVEDLEYRRDIGLAVRITLDDRVYTHVIRPTEGIDYAPEFRGWHAELLERLNWPKPSFIPASA